MKKTVLFLLTLCVFQLSFAEPISSKWTDLSLEEQAEILYDLDYLPRYDTDRLPLGTRVIEIDIESVPSRYSDIVNRVLENVEREISREGIEQSPYSTYGEEEITAFYLLVNKTGLPLGGVINLYQEGRYEEEDDSEDINWSASLRFDSSGEPFEDENGPVDELRFEWSGH